MHSLVHMTNKILSKTGLQVKPSYNDNLGRSDMNLMESIIVHITVAINSLFQYRCDISGCFW